MAQLRTEYSGLQFNEIYKRTKFYKFLNYDLKHYDFQYKVGLNIDTVQFNPTSECSAGGLYFCEESKCHVFWNDYDEKLSRVTIPDDARVYVEKYKFKADKFILTEIIDFSNMFDEFWINIAKKDHRGLDYVKNQTPEICDILVRTDIWTLRFVRDQSNMLTEDLCRYAVSVNIFALKHIKEQSEELRKFAVQLNGLALEYIQNPSEDVCKLAVQQNGLALRYIHNPSAEVCRLAVKQNNAAIKHVNTPLLLANKELMDELHELSSNEQYESVITISNKVLGQLTFDNNRRDYLTRIGYETT